MNKLNLDGVEYSWTATPKKSPTRLKILDGKKLLVSQPINGEVTEEQVKKEIAGALWRDYLVKIEEYNALEVEIRALYQKWDRIK